MKKLKMEVLDFIENNDTMDMTWNEFVSMFLKDVYTITTLLELELSYCPSVEWVLRSRRYWVSKLGLKKDTEDIEECYKEEFCNDWQLTTY